LSNFKSKNSKIMSKLKQAGFKTLKAKFPSLFEKTRESWGEIYSGCLELIKKREKINP
jgi:hypothetical protein